MKSRIYTTFFFLCGLLLALGCQRIPDVEEFATEYQSGSSSGYERLISKVSIVLPYSEEYQGLITFKFEYDSSDRVVSMDTEGNYVADDRDGNSSQYVYTPHSVRQTTTGIDIIVGPVDMDVQYYYDADGFVKSCVHEGMETFPEYVFGYTDDYLFEDGLISAISSQSADLSFVRNYEWVDGNIVREVTYENNGQQFEISYTYTEYEDKCNIDLLRLAFYLNYYKGLHFMADKVAFKGISNKNLPLKQIQFVDEETYSFEYEFDEEGYVKTMTIYMDGDLFQVMHVTYQDLSSEESVTIKEALLLEDKAPVCIEGTVLAVSMRGFVMSNDTDVIYVYGGSDWKVNVEEGDNVKVSGNMNTFWGQREVVLSGEAVVTEKATSEYEYPDPFVITASNMLDFARAGHSPCPVMFTGTLVYDGLHYNVFLGDDDVLASLEFPTIDMSSYNGKKVRIGGYYIWTSSSDEDNITMIDIVLIDIDEIKPDTSANCYIVSSSGTYEFPTVKGNSNESVGAVANADVLWESFGTSTIPQKGSLIGSVSYSDGMIAYKVSSPFKEGNAVIAAKDAYGKILWSWHIWLTDQPEEQVYKNNAGTMMDRNLGATSATPGDVGALGLLYQWGRKDPFLGSSSIGSSTLAKSTITWPSAVETSTSVGTVDYVTSHPMIFVIGTPSSKDDWHYSSRDNTLWTTFDKAKSIYDPCPAGWRVPDGGSNGVWAKAGFDDTTYDSTNEGMSFNISSPSTTWYPASGSLYYFDDGLSSVGELGIYWSTSPSSSMNGYHDLSDRLFFNYFGDAGVFYGSYRADGNSVRCQKE